MVRRIICVGLGGQGVLTVGKLLMEAAVDKNLQCTWTCKYGNEMRGGYSECNVIISDEKIASPYADRGFCRKIRSSNAEGWRNVHQ